MSIANEISKLQQNLLDCYDVCADNGAYLPEDINFDNLANCIEQISNPFNKPADWSDIRKDCPANSIALYAGELGSNYTIEDGKLTWANPNLYLKGDGNSCILTNYAPSYRTTLDIKVGNVDNWIIGARNSTGAIDFGIAYYLANFGKNTLQFSNMSSGTYTFNYGKTLIRDGVTIGTFPNTTLQNTVPFLLFGVRTEENTNITLSSGKIYYCKIYDDGVLVNHFVPVPSGLVIGDFTCPSDGMFDIVNQQFYANQGTGDFTYGKDSVTEYDNLGFTATCEDGYNVYIDGTQYGTTYASGATCSITWSTSGITTGDDITTPSALKAHKIWIEPATEGNNITAFSCARVAASGEEQQGILWAHLNLSNEISLGGDSVDFTEVRGAFGRLQTYSNKLMKALTAKNNTIKISKLSSIFYNTSSLEYSAILDCSNNTISFYGALWSSGIPKLKIKNAKPTSLQYFAFNSGIEKLSFINCDFSEVTTFSGTFNNAQSIKALPDFNFSTPCLGGGEAFVNNCSALANDIILDLSNCTALNRFIAINTSKFKGLRVSSSAPFGGASPQINVSNTSMDRTALVQLFNDLPTVSSGQIINVTGCTGTNDLTADDKTIATAKGWTITL